MYTIYSTKTCPYCINAKNLLERWHLKYQEVKVNSQEVMDELTNRLGYIPRTVPQIWHNDIHIGGYDDLVKSFKDAEILCGDRE